MILMGTTTMMTLMMTRSRLALRECYCAFVHLFPFTKDLSSIGWLYLIFCGLCMILTITEMVILLRRKLPPLAFLIMNVLKSAFWTALFVLDFVSASHRLRLRLALVGIIIDVILILAFYIPLIHGALIYHRYRSGSIYRAVDTKRFSDTSETVEEFPSSFPQAYKSLTTIEVTHDIDIEAHATDVPTSMPRRLSYNHTRDTRFDSYKQARRSFSDPNVVMGMASPMRDPPTMERSRSSTLNIPIVVINDHDAEMERKGLHTNGRAELD
ncbi:hypothetical protein ACMFMG_009612 [Clarireedia jacksonii]